MTIEDAFKLVANLDFKETHRRFAPQHGLLHFNLNGEVIGVCRYKTTPHEDEQNEALSKHPGCIQISTMPHWFASPEELQKRIDKSLQVGAARLVKDSLLKRRADRADE